MADRMSLSINGKSYKDFTSGGVTLSMEALCRTFEFTFPDKWFNSLVHDAPFVEGDKVQIAVHGEVVLEGYLEGIDISYDSHSREISVSGRSSSCDFVDASAIYKSGSWTDVKLKDLAEALTAPFGLSVSVDPWALADTLLPFKKWAVEDEETVHSCLARAARMRGLFLLTDAAGNIAITKASPFVFPYVLTVGQNIKSGSFSTNYKQRFSEYTIKSQRAGDDTFFAGDVGKGFYKTSDPQVTRYRPLLLMSDGQGTARELATRGDWERNYRAGKSRRLTYTHPGFKTPAGIFPINKLVTVSDSVIRFDGMLLLSSVSYSLSGVEEMTTLELAAPETFDVLVPPKPRPKKSGGPLW